MTNYGTVLFILSSFLVLSCKDEEEKDVVVIQFDNPSTETVVADGKSALEIIATIDKSADQDKRTIKFSTDLGTFGNGSQSEEITADLEGSATTFIKGTETGEAKVTVSVLTYLATKTVNFVEFNLSDYLKFEKPDAETLVADNLSELKIGVTTKTTPPLEDVNGRVVTLATTLGTFTNNEQTIEVLVDKTGYAATYLKSNTVGDATIKVSFENFNQTKQVEFIKANPDNVVKFNSTDELSGLADGTTPIKISASINNNFVRDNRKIVFQTDLGNFLGSQNTKELSLIADSDGGATAFLLSNLEGDAHVSVSLGDVRRTKTLEFKRAPPETISITSAFTLIGGVKSSTTISVQLSRMRGNPSPNYSITYLAEDSLGAPLGIFKGHTLSDATGKASVLFSTGESKYYGRLKITAKCVEVPNLISSTEIFVLKD